jgi:hypothetical protein
MNKRDAFPVELLDQSNNARKQYFSNYTLAHPALKGATQELIDAIFGLPGSLILVYGPTGAGKTTLSKRTEIRVTEELRSELEKDPGRLPIVSVDAAASPSGNFSWSDFFRRLLVAMGEPCVDKKKICDDHPTGRFNFTDRTPETILRFAAEQALKLRRPAALLIDEAQHMGRISSGRKLHDQLDAIKSFSTVTKTTIVMFGTYELLPFRNLSGQLSRRSIDIHLRRYDTRVRDDIAAFKNVLFAFQRHLPINEHLDLLANWEYFYERTTGSVGVLKQWLLRALHKALNDGGESLSELHLKNTALSLSQLDKMLTETLKGEDDLRESDSALAILRQRLGLTPENNLSNKKESVDDNDSATDKPKPKRTGRVGKRNPTRDPVGQTAFQAS